MDSKKNAILLYPPSGTLEITDKRELDGDFFVSGTLTDANVTIENNVTVSGYAFFTEIQLVNLQAGQ